jgi:hypothetical protein
MASINNKYRLIVTLEPPVWEALMRHVFDLNLRSENGSVARTRVINQILAQHFGIGEGPLPVKASPQKAAAPRTKALRARSA